MGLVFKTSYFVKYYVTTTTHSIEFLCYLARTNYTYPRCIERQLVLETMLALIERKNGSRCSSNSLLLLLPSLLKKQMSAALGGGSGGSKAGFPAEQVGKALRSGLENGSLVKV